MTSNTKDTIMKTFILIPNNQNKKLLTVRAETISQTATRGAKNWYGPQAVASRTTGDVGKSGFFRPYVENRSGNLNSIGVSFHVSEA